MFLSIISGVLIIVLGIAHIIYGERRLIPRIKNSSSNKLIISSSRIMTLQGGLLLICTGLLQLCAGLEIIQLNGIAAYVPLGIILINITAFLMIALTAHREVFKETLPQMIFFSIVIILLILDLR